MGTQAIIEHELSGDSTLGGESMGLAAWVLSLLVLVSGAACAQTTTLNNDTATAGMADKAVIGWIEPVRIDPGGLRFTAKIDTGADSTSLNASDVQAFTRGGKRWVRFQVRDDNDKAMELERPLERTVKIKRHLGLSQRRFVVRLGLCIDGRYLLADVNLVDRKRFKYQVLVGRKDTKGRFLVDPGKKNTTQPLCKGVNHIE